MVRARKALITGASSGIGKELAFLLRDQGVDLLLVARRREKLDEVSCRCIEKVTVNDYIVDLATDEGLNEVLTLIEKEAPDLVINCAGCGFYGPLTTLSDAEIDTLIKTNATSVVAICKKAVEVMEENRIRGTIMNVSSVIDELPLPNHALYSASKHFVTSFSKALDIECEKIGIRVLVSSPGIVATEFRYRASRGKKENFEPSFLVLDPKYVAEKILKQIESGKRKQIVDFRYWFLAKLLKILPERFAMKLISR